MARTTAGLLSSRTHGAIDYAAAGVLAALSATAAVHPSARRMLRTAAGFHASYAPLTDYEAGFVPWLTMRQHLMLDAAGALGLCAAAMLLRRTPPRDRGLLLAAGLLELAVVAASDAQVGSGPGQKGGPVARLRGTPERDQATYQPLNVLKPVAEDVWVVDSGPMHGVLPLRMTVIRLPGGGLLLHSPTRFDPGLAASLARLGPVAVLAAPNIAHWTFLQAWQHAFPDAVTWAAPGLRDRRQVRKSGLRIDRVLSDTPPAAWDGAIDLVTVPGGMGFNEVAFFHRPTRTLVLTDLVLNLEPPRLPPWLRPLARWVGITAPDGRAPAYLRAIINLNRSAASQAAARLVALRPTRVIFAHGRLFEHGAADALQRSLAWLTP